MALPLAFGAGIAVGWIAAGWIAAPRGGRFEETREVLMDTLSIPEPTPEAQSSLGHAIYSLPSAPAVPVPPAALAPAMVLCESFRSSPELSSAGYGPVRELQPEAPAAPSPAMVLCESFSSRAPGPDSVRVEVEIIQRHYRDSLYEAWVSGPIDPRLDSVRVFSRSERITLREIPAVPLPSKKKRWSVGPVVGVGYSGRGGWDWFAGVGVSYSVFSF